MSIQFRTRIKGTFDYGSELKKVGKCCFTDGSSVETTFLDCFQQSGNFYLDKNTSCETQATKGFCCSCSYLSSAQKQQFVDNLPYSSANTFYTQNTAGIVSDITECECNRIGGRWSETNNNPSLCKNTVIISGQPKEIDVRIPNACCSFFTESGEPSGITCNNVCNARECANRVVADSGDIDLYQDSVYKQYSVCGKSFLSGISPANCENPATISEMIIGNRVFENDNIGACFTLSEDNDVFSYECSVKAEPFCSGYFVGLSGSNICTHKFAPKTPTKENKIVQPITYTQAEFNSLGLTYGDEFQGGIYIGIFKPKKTNTTDYSTVYGSLNFTTQESTYYDVYDDTEYSKWAVIVNKTYLTAYMFANSRTDQNYITSYYDGFYNCYESINNNLSEKSSAINTISGKIRNGFADYYIPSIIEMMFLAEQYRNNTAISNVLNLENIFTSSTIFDDSYIRTSPSGYKLFNDQNFLYSQSLSLTQNYGKTTISPINSRVNFMLFRRLIIV
jgi:hypothetical protein